MRTSGPLRVVVVGPPLSASGGIGRVMSYALAALDKEVEYRVLDTRGLRTSPWSSAVPLLRSCFVLILLGATRRVDVAHVNISSHGSAFRKGVVVRLCRILGIPVVLHLHASSFPEFFEPLRGVRRRWVLATFDAATRVVVLGQFWRSYAQEVLYVPADRVTVLANATAAPALAEVSREEGEPLQILFLGRLGERKGVPELLDALADPQLRARPWRATLAGDGNVEAYRDRARDLGLEDRILFPGWVDTSQVAELLAEAHVLTLPSHAEGMPISVLESFAAGVPVVCTAVGSLPEVAHDEVNALVVPTGDPARLAEALLRLLDDELFRRQLGAGARQTWQQGHSIDGYSAALATQWRTVARRGPVGDPSLAA